MSQKEEALDEKTPHLRSMDAINCEGGRLFRPFGDTESHEMVSNNPERHNVKRARSHRVQEDCRSSSSPERTRSV